jgi:hypothetical protein
LPLLYINNHIKSSLLTLTRLNVDFFTSPSLRKWMFSLKTCVIILFWSKLYIFFWKNNRKIIDLVQEAKTRSFCNKITSIEQNNLDLYLKWHYQSLHKKNLIKKSELQIWSLRIKSFLRNHRSTKHGQEYLFEQSETEG